MENKFKEKIENMQTYNTPLPPGYTTKSLVKDEEKLNSNGQTEYQSGVGMSI